MERRSLVGHPNLILETLPEYCNEKGWRFASNPEKLWGENEWNSIACWIDAEEFKSAFKLQQMPGCCAVLIAYYIDVQPWTQENFDIVLRAIEIAAWAAGFGSVMMAQVAHPGKELNSAGHLLLKDLNQEPWYRALDRGWYVSKPFINAKSGNAVVYLTKDLEQEGKRPGLEIQL